MSDVGCWFRNSAKYIPQPTSNIRLLLNAIGPVRSLVAMSLMAAGASAGQGLELSCRFVHIARLSGFRDTHRGSEGLPAELHRVVGLFLFPVTAHFPQILVDLLGPFRHILGVGFGVDVLLYLPNGCGCAL